jgi:hypothetical protein
MVGACLTGLGAAIARKSLAAACLFLDTAVTGMLFPSPPLS